MKNVIALVVLVVLGVVALLVFREEPKKDKSKITEVIKSVSLDKLDTIKIRRMDGMKEKRKEESYTLKKSGDEWRLVEPINYKAVTSTVESMTTALSELKVVDVISEKAENHKKFKLDDDGGVEVTALSGKDVLAHLIVGDAKNGITFARLPKKNTVYRMKGSFRFHFDKASRMIRDKTIIKLDYDDFNQVTYETGESKLVFKKEGEKDAEVITPVDTEIDNFDESKAKTVIRSVLTLNTIDFQDEPLPEEETGLGADATKVLIEYTKDDKPASVTLLVGKQNTEKKKTYVKLADKDQIFLISDYTAKRLKFQASDYARTDEEMEKIRKRDEAAKKKENKPMPGAPGGPQNFKVTPEMLKQMQK